MSSVRAAFLVFALVTHVSLSQSLPGIAWEDQRYLALPLKAGQGAGEDIPARFSLKAFCPRVVNQAGFATSAAWASVWYGQTIAEAASCLKSGQREITAGAFSPLYAYHAVNRNPDCHTPVSLIDVLEHQLAFGSPRFSDFNDLCPATIPENVIGLANQNKIDGYAKLFHPFDPQEMKTQAMKKALHHSSPVIIGMVVPPSFGLAEGFWQPREAPDTTQTAQALCVVGYDDQKYGGAFEVVNQWGKSWGEGGFTWIRYPDMAKFARYGFELINHAACHAMPNASVVLFDDGGKVFGQLPVDNRVHKIADALKIGTRFRISIRAQGGAFVYLLFREKEVAMAFPTRNTYPYIDQNITLPGAGHYYQLEGMPQPNELYIIVSRRQLDIHWLQQQIQNQTLAFPSGENPKMLVPQEGMEGILKMVLVQLKQF